MNPYLLDALHAARDTRALEYGQGALARTCDVFRKCFGQRAAVIVADRNTFEAAGRTVLERFREAGHPLSSAFIYDDPGLYAEHSFVLRLQAALSQTEAIPVAVGSGTLNDLTKLAAHRTHRPYLCVATAASMDGYTAYGASISYQGNKQTFECPAPTAIVADIRVLAAAPKPMNAAGYADLLAKITAGADWLVADALGVEPIHGQGWSIVQDHLRELVSDPAGVRSGNPRDLGRLIEGLLLGGFAMQAAQSSRPASGAEHQFSHLWDMQHHTHDGSAPSHGFKVGLGTLAVSALYEYLLQARLETLDVDSCCANWPDKEQARKLVGETFAPSNPARSSAQDELTAVALKETEAKTISREELRAQLNRVREAWPELRQRVQTQLMPFPELKKMLHAAGAPTEPEQIGISRSRLRASFRMAYHIRRRFTVLDLAVRAGLLEPALERIFGPEGVWPAP